MSPEVNVVCIGDGFAPQCREVVERLSFRHFFRFLLANWVTPGDRSVRVAWVVDDAARIDDVRPWLAAGVPLLVPESNREISQFCSNPPRGLRYLEARDAIACLHALALDDRLHAQLAANTRR